MRENLAELPTVAERLQPLSELESGRSPAELVTHLFDELGLSLVIRRAKCPTQHGTEVGWHCVLSRPDGWRQDLGVLDFYEEHGELQFPAEPTPTAVMAMLVAEDQCDGQACGRWFLGDRLYQRLVDALRTRRH